jgi:hypothetical protein
MVSATLARQSFQQHSPTHSTGPVASLPHFGPSERDFLVFQAVACDGRSTRQAAEQFDISQTRVMQIRRHVAEWIAREVPEGMDLSPQERLRLAVHIANGRIDSLYSEAVEAWRESKAPVTSIRRGPSCEFHITRNSHGDPRYLLAASRLIDRQFALVGAAERLLAQAQPQSEGVSAAPQAVVPMIPPIEDCSPSAAAVPSAEKPRSEAIDASEADETPSSDLEERRQAFLAAIAGDTSPVHPPFTDAAGMLLDASEPVTAAPLNRHERRARQRQLERLRRKPR